MASRLHWINKVVTPIFFSFLLLGGNLRAQEYFSFSYGGPDTIFVGDDCTAPYAFHGDSVQILSLVNAHVSWVYGYDDIGLEYGDPVQAGQTITMPVPTWDDQSHIDTFYFDIYFVDTIRPIFDVASLPNPVRYYNYLSEILAPVNPTATDNCDSVRIQYVQTELADTCAGGSFYRIWTAIDEYGNETSFTQTLVLNADQSTPQFTVWPTDGSTACEIYTTNYPAWLAQNMSTIQATDPSSEVTYANDGSDVLTFGCDTSFVVTFSATDKCGHIVTTTANYQIIDTTPPIVVNLPLDTTYSCDQLVDALRLNNGLIVNDCDQNLIETFSESSTKDTNPLSCSHYSYTIVRSWSIQDHCGNETNFQQIVSVEDTIPPVFASFPQDLSVSCQQIPDFIDLVANDACNSTVTIQKDETINLSTCADNYEVIRTWTAIDACSNETSISQAIQVIDTLVPVFVNIPNDTTVNCGSVPPLQALLAVDSCDSDVFVVPTETTTQSTDPSNCGYYNYSIFRSWLASDNCGNTTLATQIIQVEDQDKPVIICPENLVWVNDNGTCDKTMIVPNPASFYDACTFAIATETISTTENVTHPAGTNANNTPVLVNLALTAVHPTSSISGNITLVIDLINVDGEATTEFFNVYAEDSTLIGQTYQTATQCGNSTTSFTGLSVEQLALWLEDGILNLFFVSAGQGEDAINDICPDGHITAQLTYDYYLPKASLSIQYTLDEGVKEDWPNNVLSILTQGSHVVTYYAADCSGNQDSCSFQIEINDAEPPTIQCPSDLTAYVPEGACLKSVSLPYPLGISDNCSFTNLFDYESSPTFLAFTDNGNAGVVPQELTYDITGVSSNAIGEGSITIFFQGDNADAGEYFLVYGENGYLVGQTQYGNTPQECHTSIQSSLVIPKDSLNNWAADGHISLRLVPETDAGTYTDFINPCGNLTASLVDSLSTVQLFLQYENTTIEYQLVDTAGFVDASKPILLDLSPDIYSVEYSVTDNNGLSGQCDWTITVLDTIAPVAVAVNTIVTVNPSGTTTSTIDPNIVNNGSYDNCEIVSMTLSPETFTCDQAGNTLPIVLTVTDASGNIGIDTAFVQITNEPPSPAFAQGVCGNDTLFIFANPPVTNGGNAYSYEWSGPNGFVAQIANPAIANPTAINVGTYTVTITGFTGCTSTNSVQVQLNVSPDPPMLTTNLASVCPGESLILSTQGFAGSTVNYFWYEGLPPNGTLQGTTASNVFTVDSPNTGQNNYYAVVNIGGCASVSSNVVNVVVNPDINLMVANDSLSVCAGSQVNLGLTVVTSGIQYYWSGPNLFSANTASTHFDASDASQSGEYIISAEKNGCVYQPDTTYITVHAVLNTPDVLTSVSICESDMLTLTVNNYESNTQLHWIGSIIDTIIQSSSLAIDGSTVQTGSWSVVAENGFCQSNPAFVQIFVNPDPEITIVSPGIVCWGTPMTLGFTSDPVAATQIWTGPDSLLSPLSAPVVIAKAGLYQLTVKTSAGCISKDSIVINPKIPPKITAISNTSDGCFSGENIQLLPTVFPYDSLHNYHWTGPNGYEISNIPEPFISNASEDITGYYELVVTDKDGCESNLMTTLVSGFDKPVVPSLTTVTNAVCDGEPISVEIVNTDQYQNDIILVQWITPKGIVSTTDYSFSKDPTDYLDKGLYAAVISVGGCESDTSASIYINIKPRPQKPSASWNSPLCMGETLRLLTTQLSGAEYIWTDPNGVFSTSTHNVYNPVINNMQLSDQGNYTVQIAYDNCLSEISDIISVSVKPLPTKPVIDFDSPICFTGGELELNISNSTKVAGAQYTWLEAPSDTMGSTSFFTKYLTDDLSSFQVGLNQYFATVQFEGCTNVSDIITIQMDDIPDAQANAGADASFCVNQEMLLNAQWPQTGYGVWHQVLGEPLIIFNPDTNITTVNNALASSGYSFEWSLSKGGCLEYSKDTVDIEIFGGEVADAGDFVDTCYVEELFLQATVPQFTTGKWSQSLTQGGTGIKIVESQNPLTKVTGLKPGTLYTFYWTLDDVGCGSSTDSISIRLANGYPFAGVDQYLCSTDGCVSISAAPLGGADNGTWSTYDSAAEILSPSSEETFVCNLATGSNPFVWTLNNGACGAMSKDTVIINFEPTPIAVVDTFDLDYGTRSMVNVMVNDKVESSYSLEIINNPNRTKIVSVKQDGEIVLDPNADFVGLDYFTYQLCNNTCDVCTEAVVVLKIGAMTDCKVPTIFTPDGDGINDFLVIPCLLSNQYLASSLSIFSQWGDEIFSARNYQNDWDGRYNGTNILEGTYFYIFDLGDGSLPKKGFFVIKY